MGTSVVYLKVLTKHSCAKLRKTTKNVGTTDFPLEFKSNFCRIPQLHSAQS